MRRKLTRLAPALTCFISFLGAHPLGAADGVIEINNARALSGGVTPGDTAGYPVSINLPGSYRLTGNLEITSINPPNTNAIEVNAEDVTIDLGGFEILGPMIGSVSSHIIRDSAGACSTT